MWPVEDTICLSDSATKAETVEIPGELKLSNPLPPPIAVALPLVARPRILANVLFGLLALSFGALFDFFFVLFVLVAIHGGLCGSTGFIVVVFLPLCFVSGVTFTGVALTCFPDALRTAPVLEITAAGLLDRRSGLSISWSNVQRAEIISGSTASVDLALRGARANWQSPFRAGVLFRRYRPKPDHVIVSTAWLDVREHVLAYAILALVGRHGGEAVSIPSHSFNMGLRLVPKRT
jgi:hypothetical protein